MGATKSMLVLIAFMPLGTHTAGNIIPKSSLSSSNSISKVLVPRRGFPQSKSAVGRYVKSVNRFESHYVQLQRSLMRP
eukprot:10325061-Ditylum_brightwellii.AAC.1